MKPPRPDIHEVANREVGKTFCGKWHIDHLIDVGGMAAVFAATHRNGKKVAVKMLHTHLANEADIRARFLREGYVANQCNHPGAVQVLDDDITPEGAAFLVMELLEGESFEQWLARAPSKKLPPHEVLSVADQVLDVLAAFHAVGVIHRDIKPGNLFVTRDGVVKVLDFGLARLRDPRVLGTSPTAAGIVLGTAAYMPPEQAQGKTEQVDARSDVFAVGAVMFKAMTGKIFMKGDGAMERLMSAMKDPAPPLAAYLPGIPKYIAHVVDTAIAFDKRERWSSANAMRDAVRAAYTDLLAEAQRRHATEARAPSEASVAIAVDVATTDTTVTAAAASMGPTSVPETKRSVPVHASPASAETSETYAFADDDVEEISQVEELDMTASEFPTLVRTATKVSLPPPLQRLSHAAGPVSGAIDSAVERMFDAVMAPSSVVVDVSFGAFASMADPMKPQVGDEKD